MQLNIDVISQIVKQVNLIKDEYRSIILLSLKHLSKSLNTMIKFRPKYLEVKKIFYKLAADGNLYLIKTFVKLGFKIKHKNILQNAALYGHLEILKWARENGCEWDQQVCSYAASIGHFEILKWARENGCKYTVSRGF